ncbi:phosphoserine phosphatase isoform X3 [Folsomia candida]|uniref:phosphoserine phosphatase isoform X3 n=1 Tax=Folsomia candida TaxID=158441 RepID=UPI001604A7F6|nr:phosphoserine phosphatase isoform X3 [Folsomia candida]
MVISSSSRNLLRRTVTTYHHYLNHNQTHPPLNPHLSSLQLTRTLSSSSAKMSNLNQAKNIWRKANAVCFDVDSTVIQEEAIDELAKYCGKGDEVQQLTMEAMKGGMDFRQALAIRLDIIRPTSTQLRNFIHGEKHRLTPYVKELVYELHKREKEVYLISGGFKSIIIPVAKDLNIPTSNVYANKLKFYYDGEYAGFDENQLTSRSGGKGAAVRDLKEKHGYETVVMVGDGMTDWEAAPPADLFIGFGGNAYRPEVKNKSKWYVTDFRDLVNELRD